MVQNSEVRRIEVYDFIIKIRSINVFGCCCNRVKSNKSEYPLIECGGDFETKRFECAQI